VARTIVKMPKISDIDDTALVLEWLVSPGDAVPAGAALLQVETSKATVEIPSPVSGTVLELMAQLGDEVSVGAPVCVLDTQRRRPDSPPGQASAQKIDHGYNTG
jgi:pyruvate/2-oxoglutarate dehydrogenase complex dihydrolipoamide acyltransferase (E2) component